MWKWYGLAPSLCYSMCDQRDHVSSHTFRVSLMSFCISSYSIHYFVLVVFCWCLQSNQVAKHSRFELSFIYKYMHKSIYFLFKWIHFIIIIKHYYIVHLFKALNGIFDIFIKSALGFDRFDYLSTDDGKWKRIQYWFPHQHSTI